MLTAITTMNVRRDAINETAQDLLRIDGVSEVYSVAGEWDLIVILRVRDQEQLADIVTNQMLKHEPVTRSQTHLAFRTYSNHDLEAMFTVGFEEPNA